jgi:hypothetical protein
MQYLVADRDPRRHRGDLLIAIRLQHQARKAVVPLSNGANEASTPSSESCINARAHWTRWLRMTAIGRYCCKSLFALVIKNSPGCRRDFRVKMWGTSSPDDKLTGDLGKVIETTQIGGRRSDRRTAGKLSPGNFGLLQHNRHECDIARSRMDLRFRGKSGRAADITARPSLT